MVSGNTVFVFTIMSIKVLSIKGFIPEIQMPFKRVSGSSATELNKIGSTLICEEERHSLTDCVTECLTKTEYPGFHSDSTVNNICYLSLVSNSSEAITPCRNFSNFFLKTMISNFSSNFSMGVYEKKFFYIGKYILKHK